MIVWRDTPSAAASSACDISRWRRCSRTRFLIMSRYLYSHADVKDPLLACRPGSRRAPRGARRAGTGICAVKPGIDVTNRVLARGIEVLQVTEDQSGYVTSILSRRARLPGLMWDLDNSPL